MTRIAITLADDYADWECALLMAVARSFLGVEIVTASPDGSPVTSMGGLKVTPDLSFAALDPATFDALVIPGGMSWEKGTAPDLAPLVEAFRAKGKIVAGICAAASALAGTGILNDVSHTGNSLDSHKAYPAYTGEAHYRDQPQAVSDHDIITAPGTSPFTFTVEILKALGLWTEEAQMELAGFRAEHV
ncbi:type 1 glutamine amidotransferase family protein [Rhizobium oryzicola]|uniref:Type 1 glutamine amidotransferase family protein n=1 Tax=Rhizobium oryzicola TaxID=1232668 RepID=A0ABT8SU93_9HYPH|nr:type 1 glutamine amidotransferase family protein [Rhizobium oryzicola]MDO1581468.1 type 1 glutamine amidotransferase family protein [Rhizobium oryzicola]